MRNWRGDREVRDHPHSFVQPQIPDKSNEQERPSGSRGTCLLHLGEIGNNSRFVSVLKIHDENRRRGGIKLLIGKQGGKA